MVSRRVERTQLPRRVNSETADERACQPGLRQSMSAYAASAWDAGRLGDLAPDPWVAVVVPSSGVTGYRPGTTDLMSGRRVVYWLVSGLGLAFLIYFTVVRRTDDGVPPWALVAAPLLVVLLIGYDIWYRRTKSPQSD